MATVESTLSPLRTLTIHMHELFLSLQDAGFTEDQALKLIIGLAGPKIEAF